jgi:hypothetical protein
VKRISKRVREEAAELCAIAASNVDCVADDIAHTSLSYSNDAWDLVADAMDQAIRNTDAPPYYAAMDQIQFDQHRAVCAEAEALLRTNWSPP